MVFRIFNSLWHHIRYIPLLSALSVSRGRAFDRRSRALGALVGLVVRYFPIARRRVERELSNVYPDMPRSKRLSLCRDMGRNMGRTLFEIFHCAEFQTLQDRHSVSGPGLEALFKAKAEGKGALIVSGHFGQWEAVRAALKARDMETGAVYRPQTNRHMNVAYTLVLRLVVNQYLQQAKSELAHWSGTFGRVASLLSC